MTEACDRLRSANLLGALVMAVHDRVAAEVGTAGGRAESDIAALVILSTTVSGTSQDALRGILGLTQSGAVRVVDRLARDGLVERGPGPDARTHAITPTVDGRAVAQRALDARQVVTTELLDLLDVDGRAAITAAMEELLAGMTGGRVGALRICRLCDTEACGHPARCPVTRAVGRSEGAPA